ncbi:MAG: beta/alpha barrel domain-containing protein [Desulfitobacteriaceae bacterium]
MAKLQLPKKVKVTELFARDGLQNESCFFPTDAKVWFINQISELGFPVVEVSNFSHPVYLPQFKDCEEVLKRIKRKPGTIYKCYGMTDVAMGRAVKAKEEGYGPDVVSFTFSMTDVHSQRNAGRTIEKYWTQIPEYVKMLHDAGIKADFAMAGVFGCPISGAVNQDIPLSFIEKALEMGCDSATPCDTTGEATPDRVYEFFTKLRERFPKEDVHLCHFHDSRGMAMANYFTAMLAGVDNLEFSLGQLGGQPNFIQAMVPGKGTGKNYCPSDITGNGSTEDGLVMLDEMGIETGIDIDGVLELGRVLEHSLGRDLRPYCTKTGRIPKKTTNWYATPPYRGGWWAYPKD